MELIAEAVQHTRAMQTAKAERDDLRSMYDGARKKYEEQHVTVR